MKSNILTKIQRNRFCSFPKCLAIKCIISKWLFLSTKWAKEARLKPGKSWMIGMRLLSVPFQGILDWSQKKRRPNGLMSRVHGQNNGNSKMKTYSENASKKIGNARKLWISLRISRTKIKWSKFFTRATSRSNLHIVTFLRGVLLEIHGLSRITHGPSFVSKPKLSAKIPL